MTHFYTGMVSLLFVLSYSITAAQDSTISLSKFEEFSSGKGRLLRIESESIASMGMLNCEFVSATDLNSKQLRSAVRFRTGWRLTTEVIEKNWIYVDLEDIPILLIALDTMRKELMAPRPSPQRSVTVIASNDVRLSLRHDEGILSGGWALFISQQFTHLRSEVPWRIFKISTRYLDQLQQALKKSLEM